MYARALNSRFNCKDVRFTTGNKYIVCVTFFSRNRSLFSFLLWLLMIVPIVVETFSTLFPIDAVFHLLYALLQRNSIRNEGQFPNASLEYRLEQLRRFSWTQTGKMQQSCAYTVHTVWINRFRTECTYFIMGNWMKISVAPIAYCFSTMTLLVLNVSCYTQASDIFGGKKTVESLWKWISWKFFQTALINYSIQHFDGTFE